MASAGLPQSPEADGYLSRHAHECLQMFSCALYGESLLSEGPLLRLVKQAKLRNLFQNLVGIT